MTKSILAAAAVLAAAAFATPAAAWNEDATTCASHPDPQTVLAACNRALSSGELDTEETARTRANRAWAHIQFNDLASARADLMSAISEHKEGGRASAWNMLGVVHESLGAFEEAEKAYLRALDQLARQGEEETVGGPPTDIAATTNLARLYEHIGADDKAAVWVRKSFEIAPDHPGMQDLYKAYELK